MSEYDSWRMLLEDFRLGHINEPDARCSLDDLSYDMSEEELEEAEEKLEEYILALNSDRGYVYGYEMLDSLPEGEDEEHSSPLDEHWGNNFKDY